MVSFTPCKINLGLRITGKRSDGFHAIDSVFYPVPWFDVLEFVEATDVLRINHSMTLSGIIPDGNPDQNLVLKACGLLKDAGYSIPALDIFLYKSIPVGAGLGGGSSNGAGMLNALNSFFDLKIGKDKLLDFAAMLGSDCPFFVFNTPCYVTGRGEVLEPLSLSLKGCFLVLANPGIHISTAEAFRSININETITSCKQIIERPLNEWRFNLINDFQDSASLRFPIIGQCIDHLYEKGAIYAAMSGTGSTVYGVFETNPGTLLCELPFTKTIQL